MYETDKLCKAGEPDFGTGFCCAGRGRGFGSGGEERKRRSSPVCFSGSEGEKEVLGESTLDDCGFVAFCSPFNHHCPSEVDVQFGDGFQEVTMDQFGWIWRKKIGSYDPLGFFGVSDGVY